MNDGKLFDKYYARVKRESLIKSAVCAVIVGFAVNFLTAFIAWMVYSKIFLAVYRARRRGDCGLRSDFLL